jgi:hypothetical protein
LASRPAPRATGPQPDPTAGPTCHLSGQLDPTTRDPIFASGSADPDPTVRTQLGVRRPMARWRKTQTPQKRECECECRGMSSTTSVIRSYTRHARAKPNPFRPIETAPTYRHKCKAHANDEGSLPVNGGDMREGAKLQSFAPHPACKQDTPQSRRKKPTMHRNNNSAGTPTDLICGCASPYLLKLMTRKVYSHIVTYFRGHIGSVIA